MLLERLHERRFGEARGRLREVLRCVEAEQLQRFARRHLGEWADLFLRLLGALGVDAKESVEQDAPAVGAEHVLPRVDVHARVLEARRGHLRGDRALPDHRVEAELVRLQEPLHAIGRARHVGRPDRLVGLLRALRPRLVVTRLVECVGNAEFAHDDVPGLLQRALGDVQRVGPHIRDEANGSARAHRDAFVQLLREDHRALHRVAELPRRLLLEGRCRERGRGVATALALLEALDDVRRVRESGAMLLGRLAVVDLELVALVLDDLRRERLAGMVREGGLERPVLDRDECRDLTLAVDDETERDGLHPAGGQAVADLLPEQRGHRVAHEPVDDAARLLRVHQILVDLAGMLEGLVDRRGGDLVEGHAAELGLRDLDDIREMPGDRLAFAVEVGGEPDMVRPLRLAPEGSGVLLRVIGDDVLRRERLEVHAHLRFRQIPDVPERGLDLVGRTEHPF